MQLERQPGEDPSRGGAFGLEAVLIALGLALAVSIRALEPIWRVHPGLLAMGILTAVAYLVFQSIYRRSRRRGFERAVLITVVVSQPLLLALLLLDLGGSRLALIGEMALLLLAVIWTVVRAPQAARMVVAGGFAGLAALPTLIGLGRPPVPTAMAPTPDSGRHYVFASYHDVSITTHVVLDHETQDGGAMTLLPDGRVLLVAGSGVARLLDFTDGLNASPVEIELPIDVAAYRALGRRIPEFYRVFDAVYDEGSLLVSYVHWDSANECYTIRLAEAEFDGARAGPWVTRFESRPCAVLSHMYNTSGGRITLLDPSRLLLSVGSFGLVAPYERSKVEASDHGKILELDRRTWSSRIFSAGHRNVQGLLVVGDRIWATEHGPYGGDELNLVVEGSDYGWPFVSYGTDYGKKTLASGATPGDHSGFTQPIHSWLPSIGISNLIEASSGQFPMWRGDLLIGALDGLGNGRGLFRVRLVDTRVVTVERIPTRHRVRDLLELPDDGPLVLWDGRGGVSVVKPADHVFTACAGCHAIRNAQHGIGPDLYGVVGSPVGRHSDYPYSGALRRHGGDWTPERLDRFLEGPEAEIPGTSMEHEGVADPAERAEIIRFLGELSAGRPVD